MKPSIPQGTRDFSAEVVRKRNYIFNTIRSVFELYGFEPLETPAMENLDTLMGKYGEEGDKLIFKVLNNGLDNPNKKEKTEAGFQQILAGRSDKNITERALRYDLTIPFARYIAMNHGQLSFPFKRYQVQPVWRADRPQRGRYREFYQCDCDIVGSSTLMNELELIQIYNSAFDKLQVDVEIKINNRKILASLAEKCGGADKLTDITIAIDKLDKIGLEKVKEELAGRGLDAAQINTIEKYLSVTGSCEEKIAQVKTLLSSISLAEEGLTELEYLLKHSNLADGRLHIDFTLARGLNYYTGTIFEVKAKNVTIGSIGGGGRYDDLTGLFGLPGMPGVGISFGVDRIYDVMDELNLFPETLQQATDVLFFNLGEKESMAAFALMQQFRRENIRCEMYHEKAKFDKQFKYADKKRIPFVVIMGEEEVKQNKCNIKNLSKGEQLSFDNHNIKEMINYLRS